MTLSRTSYGCDFKWVRLREAAAAKPPNVAYASSLRLPALLRIALQTGISRRSSASIPMGSDSRRKLEAYATLLRSSNFATTSFNRAHF